MKHSIGGESSACLKQSTNKTNQCDAEERAHYLNVIFFREVMKHQFFLELISDSVRRISLIALCIIFILGGAVNIGVTSLAFALPFVFILFYKLDTYGRAIKNRTIIVLSVVCMFFIWNKPQNSLIFPYLNAQIEVPAGWAYMRVSESTSHPLVPPEDINSWKTDMESDPDYILWLKVSEKSILATMHSVEIRYEMNLTRLNVVFKDASGKLFSITPKELIKAVAFGTIQSNDLNGVESFQSTWSQYLGNLMLWPSLPLFLFN